MGPGTARLWHKAFLERRPTLSLGLFRLAIACTVGAHMLPSFFHLDENFLATAFKTKNPSFFPIWTLQLVDRSPDWLVMVWVAIFCVSLMTFALGLCSQTSCIVMTIACYYFYALNAFQIGTLSFDILLVTLVLMCVTSYHGDFLSLDALWHGNPRWYKRLRPFFVQRLLQIQLAVTYWCTALHKITAGGNWLTENPYCALMHYPPTGVVRSFPGRAWLAQHPGLCDTIGLTVIVCELLVPVLWFIPRLRAIGIALGFLFHLLLWATLHVPTIFLFLFPPMMLLFIAPESLVAWIERRQARHAEQGRGVLVYDGQCGFCVASVRRLRVLDLFGWLDPLDFHRQPDLEQLNPGLTPQRCRSEMMLLEPNGNLSGGFDAFAKMTQRLPLLWWLWPVIRLPGAAVIGRWVYRWIATHRYLLHRNPTCKSNQCHASDFN
ncbi:MAG: DUF393 domain-containing protein [Candidatus Omnitrophica bacterium]|nr:DUF393 domain-containing protein [Candidatus Omnitrophota bacterium]